MSSERGKGEVQTYHEAGLLVWQGVARLQNLARDFVNEDGLFPRLQRLQCTLLRDAPKLFVLDGQAIKFLADLSEKCSLF